MSEYSFVDELINEVIEKEGGYCDHPSDLGGETCWGITISEARRNGYKGPMNELPIELARQIYKLKYWIEPGFDKVGEHSKSIAWEIFDTGVNMGVGKATEFLQMALNAFNRQGLDYADIDEDGRCGPATLKALAAYLQKRSRVNGEETMLKALNCLQGARYIDISRKRPQNEDFTFGWISTRIEIGS